MLLQYLVHTNQNFNLVLYFGLLLSAVKKNTFVCCSGTGHPRLDCQMRLNDDHFYQFFDI